MLHFFCLCDFVNCGVFSDFSGRISSIFFFESVSSLIYRCLLCVYQALAPANAPAMSDFEIDQLTPNTMKIKFKEHSRKSREMQGLISPLGDSASMLSRLSRCGNEIECLRMDLSSSFVSDVDQLDLVPIKMNDEPQFDPDAFTFKWDVGRELQRNGAGGLRTDFCIGRQHIQLRVWYQEVRTSSVTTYQSIH